MFGVLRCRSVLRPGLRVSSARAIRPSCVPVIHHRSLTTVASAASAARVPAAASSLSRARSLFRSAATMVRGPSPVTFEQKRSFATRYIGFNNQSGFGFGVWNRWGRWVRIIVLGGGGAVAVLWVVNRDHVPFSDRGRSILIPRSMELNIGASSFRSMLQNNKSKVLPPNHPYSILVRRISEEIIRGNPEHLSKMTWEFAVIDSPVQNAMVFPGGKVVVMSGLIKLLQGRDQADLLSVVIAHEMGHTVARHSAEKLTKGFFLVFPVQLVLAQVFDSTQISSIITKLFLDLPFSRGMESEADLIGLHLLADAGIPSFLKAPELFRRLRDTKGREQADFLSTHPSGSTRISQIEKWIPEIVDAHRHKLPASVTQRVPPRIGSSSSSSTGMSSGW